MADIDWVVLRQNERDDSWNVVYVDVSAETAKAAIEETATAEYKGGAGRYVAVPNEYWVGQNVTVKKIASVTMEEQEMV